jgi:hypothetical protein
MIKDIFSPREQSAPLDKNLSKETRLASKDWALQRLTFFTERSFPSRPAEPLANGVPDTQE